MNTYDIIRAHLRNMQPERRRNIMPFRDGLLLGFLLCSVFWTLILLLARS